MAAFAHPDCIGNADGPGAAFAGRSSVRQSRRELVSRQWA
jgi:hypothetical protein